jgi:hypothetical protein
MISDELLDAIRGCGGLIYLQGGTSTESFWVALERDYALRAGKRVYSFDPTEPALKPDHSSPLDLNVFIASTHHDRTAVELVLSVLRQRFFALKFDHWRVPRKGEVDPEDFDYELMMASTRITSEIFEAIQQGGYVVTFWSKMAAESEWVHGHYAGAYTHNRDRILFALLDDTPIPEISRDRYIPLNAKTVQIYGDAERSEMQRIDDLIVNLYWLIYRNTRQNQLS